MRWQETATTLALSLGLAAMLSLAVAIVRRIRGVPQAVVFNVL